MSHFDRLFKLMSFISVLSNNLKQYVITRFLHLALCMCCFLTSCPEIKIKPLGPMLLNGLTKLINEYKEVSDLVFFFNFVNILVFKFCFKLSWSVC